MVGLAQQQQPAAPPGAAAAAVPGVGGARSSSARSGPYRLDLLNADGEGTVLYPSGRVALTACKGADGGTFWTFTADAERFRVLATFDSEGVGSVNYPDGRPWLVVTRDGWSLSTQEGRITQSGRWPRANAAPIMLQASPHLAVEFVDRQHITARLQFGDFDRTFQCGAHTKRAEGSYLKKVVRTLPGGRLELDLVPIRRRICEVGSVYIPKGPHHTISNLPGLGSVRRLVSALRPDSPVAALVADLDVTQSRLQRINTLPIKPYGTAHPPKRLADPLPDFGTPPGFDATAGTRRRAATANGAAGGYEYRRRRLPLISVAELEARVAGPSAPKDTLFAVAVLADWNQVSSRLEHKHLEAAAWELSQRAAAAAAGGGGGGPPDPAQHVTLVKVDASESTTLQRRYGFKTVPMFLFYYSGRLVDAGNDVRSKQELIDRALGALTKGRRGDTLGPGFSFGGADNSVLDGIRADMSLRRR